jgi:hypothetical protein
MIIMATVGGIGTTGRRIAIIIMVTGRYITITGTMVRRRTTNITTSITRAPGADTTVPIISRAVSPNPALDSPLAHAEIGDIVTDCDVKDTHFQWTIRVFHGLGPNEQWRPGETESEGAAGFPAAA